MSSRLSCSTATFADLPTDEALHALGAAGFEGATIAVARGGQVDEAVVRNDYETAHLLLGFGCAAAKVTPVSLTVELEGVGQEHATSLIRSSCVLAHALGVGRVTVTPWQGTAPAEVDQWHAIGEETEVELLLRWPDGADRESALPRSVTLTDALQALSLGGEAPWDSVREVVVPEWSEKADMGELLRQLPRPVQWVVCLSAKGSVAERVEQAARVRAEVESAVVG